MKIKYETVMENFLKSRHFMERCTTPCPNGKSSKVGAPGCECCEFFDKHHQTENIIYCNYKE